MVTALHAQRISNSPYTRFGLGEIVQQGNGRSMAMSYAGIADRNPWFINHQNPAANTAFFNQSFLFEVGTDFLYQNLKSKTNEQKNYASGFKYLSAGFSAQKWWSIVFGLSPYSTVGYTVVDSFSVINDEGTSRYSQAFVGEGGLNKVYLGNSFSLHKNFSVGLNASYLFGSTDRNQSLYTVDNDSYLALSYKNRYIYSGFLFSAGLQYTDTIKSRKNPSQNLLQYGIGFIADNESKINLKNTLFIQRNVSLYGNAGVSDTIANDTLIKSSVKIPLRFGVGISLVVLDKLTLNLDYMVQDWSNFSIPGQVGTFMQNKYYAAGFEFVNDKYSTRYFKTINYRLGGFYSNTSLVLNNQQINDYGVSLGIGFPLRSFIINLSALAGSKGTTDFGLFNETYTQFHVNIVIHDIWFVKRKFQ